MNDKPIYRWPDLSPVIRQYVVRDQHGRIGIAYEDNCHHPGVLFAHPADLPSRMGAGSLPGTEVLPAGAIIMTDTVFHLHTDGRYYGWWVDNNHHPIYVPPERMHDPSIHDVLTIVDDLGYLMPDKWAAQALAGSDQNGHWDYGARLGKVGGEPPVKGQLSGEMTAEQAERYAREVGETAGARGIRLAAKNGYIPGARKIGRDWLIPYEGFEHYLDHRPKPGRKADTTK